MCRYYVWEGLTIEECAAIRYTARKRLDKRLTRLHYKPNYRRKVRHD